MTDADTPALPCPVVIVRERYEERSVLSTHLCGPSDLDELVESRRTRPVFSALVVGKNRRERRLPDVTCHLDGDRREVELTAACAESRNSYAGLSLSFQVVGAIETGSAQLFYVIRRTF